MHDIIHFCIFPWCISRCVHLPQMSWNQTFKTINIKNYLVPFIVQRQFSYFLTEVLNRASRKAGDRDALHRGLIRAPNVGQHTPTLLLLLQMCFSSVSGVWKELGITHSVRHLYRTTKCFVTTVILSDSTSGLTFNFQFNLINREKQVFPLLNYRWESWSSKSCSIPLPWESL